MFNLKVTSTDLLVGVLLFSATLSNGIKTLLSGKYVATLPFGISYGIMYQFLECIFFPEKCEVIVDEKTG